MTTSNSEFFEGAEVPPDAEDWIRANPFEAQRILSEIQQNEEADTIDPPELEWAHEGEAEFPKPILGCAKMGGAVLSEGEICVLSAAGGTGKSTLAVSIALSVAVADDDLHEPMELEGELFHGFGGTVVYATYEDPPSVMKWKLRNLADLWDADLKRNGKRAADALKRIAVVSMRRWPLYGPVGDRASYNTVPGNLAGWLHFWNLVSKAKPILIIIDPALTAFVGEANSPTQAMAFLDALSSEAGRHHAGVLLLAHSTKSSRGFNSDPFHPGMVSGTGAWTDHVRGVLTMGEYSHTIPGTGRQERGKLDEVKEAIPVLRVYKANWGPQRITVRLEAETIPGNDTPLGFVAASPWGYGQAPGAYSLGDHVPHPSTSGASAKKQSVREGVFDDFA